MKRVDQQTLHEPPDQTGDCFRAAVASLLEWPIERVPDFRLGMPPYEGAPIPECYECLGVWKSPGFW